MIKQLRILVLTFCLLVIGFAVCFDTLYTLIKKHTQYELSMNLEEEKDAKSEKEKEKEKENEVDETDNIFLESLLVKFSQTVLALHHSYFVPFENSIYQNLFPEIVTPPPRSQALV